MILPTASMLPTARDLHLAGAAQEELLARAGETGRAVFGDKVFVRAVVEISNFCRQNCSYCGMRRDNRALQRYRADLDVLRRVIFDELPPMVTDVNFQTGEDPKAVREILLPLIREIRASTSLGVSVCLGLLDEKLYAELHDAGAAYYIIKIETGNEHHFAEMQGPGTLAKRVEAIRHLAATGWLVSSGFIAGLPAQTDAHILETLDLLNQLPLAGCSVSPFIPGAQTPLADAETSPAHLAINSLAWMRLMNPGHVIPAVSAMNIVDSSGYVQALKAGANLATINLTPDDWREDYLLYRRNRVIMGEERVRRAIGDAGLQPSTTGLIDALRA